MPTSIPRECDSVAEPITFESPIRSPGLLDRGLTDESETIKTLVRAGPESTTAGLLAVDFGSSRRVGETLVCGSRPGEWLILGEPSPVTDDLDLSDHVSVIDLTHGRAVLRLTSAHAASILEKICSLDLSEAMTPDGAVTSATVANVVCDLIRDDANGVRSYLIVCDRSLGEFLASAILDAAGEFVPRQPGQP
jgi:heterotetrameric sarcosine oxidase gamma subunit